MTFRDKYKTLIYQYALQNPELLAWFTENYPFATVTEHFSEFGLTDNASDIKYPAIRYKLVKDDPIRRDKCDGLRFCTLHIYIESAQENTNEVDELIELFRNIYTEKEGRAIGIFSESTGYVNDFGAESSMKVNDSYEVTSDVVKNQAQSTSVSGVNNLQLSGYRWFGILILSMDVAE